MRLKSKDMLAYHLPKCHVHGRALWTYAKKWTHKIINISVSILKPASSTRSKEP